MSLKEYQIGDKIIECKPLVHTLRDEKKAYYCDNCFGRISGKRLSRYGCIECGQMFYCSIECKLTDNSVHQKECHLFKEYYYPYLKHHFYRLILRTYLMSIDDKDIETEEYVLYDGNKRSFNGLVTHSSEIKSDMNRFQHFQYIYETIYYSSKEFGFEFNYKLLYQLFCRLVINHFNIMTYNETRTETIGSGLYMKAAVLNHSCEPNAATIYFGSILVLKAIKPIKTGDEITINYVDIELDRIRRQNCLKNSFYFICQCIKCQTNDLDINYQVFDELKKQIRLESKKGCPDWVSLSLLTDRWIDICYRIYSRFHPQLLPILIDILSAKYQNKYENKQKLNNYVNELQESVLLIYGSNHVIYKSLKKCIEKKVFYKL